MIFWAFIVFACILAPTYTAAEPAVLFLDIVEGTVFEAPDCHEVCVHISNHGFFFGRKIKIYAQFYHEQSKKWRRYNNDFSHELKISGTQYECFDYKPLPYFFAVDQTFRLIAQIESLNGEFIANHGVSKRFFIRPPGWNEEKKSFCNLDRIIRANWQLEQLVGCTRVNRLYLSLFPNVDKILMRNALSSIRSINFELVISGYTVHTLAGLENLATIGGDLRIENTKDLVKVQQFDNLVYIGGKLIIQNNAHLKSLYLPALRRIKGENFRLVTSDKLPSTVLSQILPQMPAKCYRQLIQKAGESAGQEISIMPANVKYFGSLNTGSNGKLRYEEHENLESFLYAGLPQRYGEIENTDSDRFGVARSLRMSLAKGWYMSGENSDLFIMPGRQNEDGSTGQPLIEQREIVYPKDLDRSSPFSVTLTDIFGPVSRCFAYATVGGYLKLAFWDIETEQFVLIQEVRQLIGEKESTANLALDEKILDLRSFVVHDQTRLYLVTSHYVRLIIDNSPSMQLEGIRTNFVKLARRGIYEFRVPLQQARIESGYFSEVDVLDRTKNSVAIVGFSDRMNGFSYVLFAALTYNGPWSEMKTLREDLKPTTDECFQNLQPGETLAVSLPESKDVIVQMYRCTATAGTNDFFGSTGEYNGFWVLGSEDGAKDFNMHLPTNVYEYLSAAVFDGGHKFFVWYRDSLGKVCTSTYNSVLQDMQSHSTKCIDASPDVSIGRILWYPVINQLKLVVESTPTIIRGAFLPVTILGAPPMQNSFGLRLNFSDNAGINYPFVAFKKEQSSQIAHSIEISKQLSFSMKLAAGMETPIGGGSLNIESGIDKQWKDGNSNQEFSSTSMEYLSTGDALITGASMDYLMYRSVLQDEYGENFGEVLKISPYTQPTLSAEISPWRVMYKPNHLFGHLLSYQQNFDSEFIDYLRRTNQLMEFSSRNSITDSTGFNYEKSFEKMGQKSSVETFNWNLGVGQSCSAKLGIPGIPLSVSLSREIQLSYRQGSTTSVKTSWGSSVKTQIMSAFLDNGANYGRWDYETQFALYRDASGVLILDWAVPSFHDNEMKFTKERPDPAILAPYYREDDRDAVLSKLSHDIYVEKSRTKANHFTVNVIVRNWSPFAARNVPVSVMARYVACNQEAGLENCKSFTANFDNLRVRGYQEIKDLPKRDSRSLQFEIAEPTERRGYNDILQVIVQLDKNNILDEITRYNNVAFNTFPAFDMLFFRAISQRIGLAL